MQITGSISESAYPGDLEVKLGEYDKREWFDVARLLKPALTEDEYGRMWSDFVAFKELHQKLLATQ